MKRRHDAWAWALAMVLRDVWQPADLEPSIGHRHPPLGFGRRSRHRQLSGWRRPSLLPKAHQNGRPAVGRIAGGGRQLHPEHCRSVASLFELRGHGGHGLLHFGSVALELLVLALHALDVLTKHGGFLQCFTLYAPGFFLGGLHLFHQLLVRRSRPMLGNLEATLPKVLKKRVVIEVALGVHLVHEMLLDLLDHFPCLLISLDPVRHLEPLHVTLWVEHREAATIRLAVLGPPLPVLLLLPLLVLEALVEHGLEAGHLPRGLLLCGDALGMELLLAETQGLDQVRLPQVVGARLADRLLHADLDLVELLIFGMQLILVGLQEHLGIVESSKRLLLLLSVVHDPDGLGLLRGLGRALEDHEQPPPQVKPNRSLPEPILQVCAVPVPQ
mmetsp:Transcript_101994/g.243168  ORF Transcript_101994/g.243168 Transcript_101994/m.243168 type:complete len:386 (+) Transcript_101994:2183-3340(+)